MRLSLSLSLLISVLLTVLAPSIRGSQLGGYSPDIWTVIFLLIVRTPLPFSLKRSIIFGIVLGLLRSSVSIASPVDSWAILFSSLWFREAFGRRFSDTTLYFRFLVAVISLLPVLVGNFALSSRYGLDFFWSQSLVGICFGAILISLFPHQKKMLFLNSFK